MKKTLIALLALSGVACGATTFTGDFAWTAGSTPTFTFEDTADLMLVIDGMTIDGTKQTWESASPKSNNVYSGTLTPSTNVGTGGTWTIDFVIVNNGEDVLTLESITLDAFAYNNGGSAQSADFLTRNITFALTGDASTSVVHSFTNIDADQDVYNWDTNPTLTFAAPLEIEAGSQKSFTLSVAKEDSVGCFIGLSGATLNAVSVPEPATASLSLLGLAALMIRRRR